MRENRPGNRSENEAFLMPDEQRSLLQSFDNFVSGLRIPGLKNLGGSMLLTQGDSSDHRSTVTHVTSRLRGFKALGSIQMVSQARLGHSYYTLEKTEHEKLHEQLQTMPEYLAIQEAILGFFINNGIKTSNVWIIEFATDTTNPDEPSPELGGTTQRQVIGFTACINGTM